jgi:CBS domain-containing protein
VFLDHNLTAKEAINEMKKHNFDQFPVKNDGGDVIGMLTSALLM